MARVGLSRPDQGPPDILKAWGEPGVLESCGDSRRALGSLEHGTSPPLLCDPAARVDIHLQHLHHPLVPSGTFNELGQGQLA